MTDETNTAAETEQKPAREKSNGVTRPAEGTKTGRIWDLANEISQAKGRPALRDEVMAAGTDEGIAKGTIATQYGRWCTFYGVDRTQRDQARQEQRAADKAAAAAAKQAAKEQEGADEDETEEA